MQTAKRNDSLSELERHWKEAHVVALRARDDYQDLARCDDADPQALNQAWLRLWRAEEEDRNRLRELDGA